MRCSAPRLANAAFAGAAALASLLSGGCGRAYEPVTDGRAPPRILADTQFTGFRGRYAQYRVRLEDAGGQIATGRLLRPSADSGPYPAVLLNDGRELNSDVIDCLPADFGNVVVLALDYPEELPYQIDLTELLLGTRTLRQAAWRIPEIFSAGGAYLAGRADVDSTRLAIAGTSFAVPFTVIAAARDQRFRNVALIYGAGGFADVLAANLTLRPAVLRRAVAWLLMQPFADLEPERYIAQISPRPIVMVNGIDDPQMPRAAVEALYEAAGDPKTITWLRTGHLMPTDTTLIRALVDSAFVRLPVLAGSRGQNR